MAFSLAQNDFELLKGIKMREALSLRESRYIEKDEIGGAQPTPYQHPHSCERLPAYVILLKKHPLSANHSPSLSFPLQEGRRYINRSGRLQAVDVDGLVR